MSGWVPDWTPPPAEKGDDEAEVEALYREEMRKQGLPELPWASLEEWKRESWRREYRDA
jgi:hypothetical protein